MTGTPCPNSRLKAPMALSLTTPSSSLSPLAESAGLRSMRSRATMMPTKDPPSFLMRSIASRFARIQSQRPRKARNLAKLTCACCHHIVNDQHALTLERRANYYAPFSMLLRTVSSLSSRRISRKKYIFRLLPVKAPTDTSEPLRRKGS